MSTGWWILAGLFLAISAGGMFYLTLSRYQRLSGFSFDIAILRTLAFIALFVGSAALAWWLGGKLALPGRWRDLAILLLFSALEATLGRGGLFLVTLLLERRYHL